jgi:hypothetical protein
MDKFTAIRNGLLDHALAGKLSPFDFGMYVFLIMRADYSTGIYHGCAMTIACQFGNPSLKEHVQKALRRLREKKYINYRNGDGSRGAYLILINKFFVRVGEVSGTRLNAWKHNGLVHPEYERQNGGDTVETLSRHGGDTVVAPNKDIKTEDVSTTTSTQSQTSDNSLSKLARKKTPRRQTTILSAYPQMVSDVVNAVCSKWPDCQSNGDKIHTDVAAFASRVDQILRDNADANPELLIRAAENYLWEPKKFYRAPQFFFGPGNGTEAPWVAYARMIVHETSKSQAAEAVN